MKNRAKTLWVIEQYSDDQDNLVYKEDRIIMSIKGESGLRYIPSSYRTRKLAREWVKWLKEMNIYKNYKYKVVKYVCDTRREFKKKVQSHSFMELVRSGKQPKLGCGCGCEGIFV